MACKLTFLANVLLQTEILNRYLVPEAQHGFGLKAWQDLWNGNRSWEVSGLFPRVTLCDFTVGNNLKKYVYCQSCSFSNVRVMGQVNKS